VLGGCSFSSGWIEHWNPHCGLWCAGKPEAAQQPTVVPEELLSDALQQLLGEKSALLAGGGPTGPAKPGPAGDEGTTAQQCTSLAAPHSLPAYVLSDIVVVAAAGTGGSEPTAIC